MGKSLHFLSHTVWSSSTICAPQAYKATGRGGGGGRGGDDGGGGAGGAARALPRWPKPLTTTTGRRGGGFLHKFCGLHSKSGEDLTKHQEKMRKHMETHRRMKRKQEENGGD
ncbi:voltage-gated potassium channel subunit beta-3-like isoform X2 [Hyla sarda]|uniref:voltage-gated potassium channel subunit beta-3-like isoform X2 n=1 Tax=Hyla sarda TaxID=327740 RepID=UPI0024C28920|nr:voltage-gated potassium channel subunit beta-3-like isoform X2 [Hyla sarda]